MDGHPPAEVNAYPDALFDALAAEAGVKSGARVLEIGCGEGQASAPMARRGWQLTCLEASAERAAKAREVLAPFPACRVEAAWFEEWPGSDGSYDLVASATAFHHLSPETRFAKSAQSLKPKGNLACFWNWPGNDPALDERVTATARDFQASGLFEAPQVKAFPWKAAYDAEGYVRLMEGSSAYQKLEGAAREAMFAGIRKAIEASGNKVEVPWTAVLFLARKL